MKFHIKIQFLLFTLIFLASCTVGDPYQKPELPVKKKQWSETASPSAIIQKDWWTGFKDPYLNKLVSESITGSYDLKILMGRIEEAGATIKEKEAERLPEVTVGTNGNFSRTNEGSVESYSAKAGFNWEIDLWGKKKHSAQAVMAEYKASQADYRAGYLKLVSELALAYFRIRQKDEQAGLNRKFLKDNRLILNIYQNQYKEGIIADKKVLRQKAVVSGLKRDLLEVKRQRKILENRITTLLGKPAGEYKVPVRKLHGQIKRVKVPMGLPADLLNRRPDIIAAEYRVLKAHHLIGEAQAARLPSISLTGSGGLASAALSSLLSSWTLGIAPAISLPIFDGGARKARIAINEAKAQIAADQYRKTVMTAFQDVENALVNLANRALQRDVLDEKVADLKKVRRQIHAKLKMGLISQLELMDIENELFTSEKELLQMDRQLLDDKVILFKALGGGWPKEIVK
jgi:NodT family efflux transporter outer membrane factor (OMF) lipoprotein